MRNYTILTKEFCQEETSQIRQCCLRLSVWNTGKDQTRSCLLACVARVSSKSGQYTEFQFPGQCDSFVSPCTYPMELNDRGEIVGTAFLPEGALGGRALGRSLRGSWSASKPAGSQMM